MKQRQTELDILRFCALLAVVAIHTCGGTIRTMPITSPVWEIVNSFEASITWCVPVYVMISGRFFLDNDRTVTIENIWRKSIFRLIKVFLIWSVIYQFMYILKGEGLNWKGNLSQILIGPYHFWYLHTLIWLYAVTPILRKITTDKRSMEYFLFFFFVFHFWSSYGVKLPLIGTTLEKILANTNFHFALGYTGYYILGYYLHKYPIRGKKEITLYILGILSVCFTVASVFFQTRAMGKNVFTNATYPMPNIIIESAALYNLFVNRISRVSFADKERCFWARMTEYSFGVYIVHGIVVEMYGAIGILPILEKPLIFVPVCTLLVLTTSMAFVHVLKKLPIIGKHFV